MKTQYYCDNYLFYALDFLHWMRFHRKSLDDFNACDKALSSCCCHPCNHFGGGSTVSFIVFGKLHCFGTVDIFVISRPKWLKFGVQAHFFKMFGHTKFQLSISCTFKVMKLLVEITKKSNSNFLHKWAYHSSSVDFSAKVHSWGHLVHTQKKALRHSNYVTYL